MSSGVDTASQAEPADPVEKRGVRVLVIPATSFHLVFGTATSAVFAALTREKP